MDAPRLIQLVDFARPHGGSFVPMLSGLLGEAALRGWGAEAVLFEASRGCAWVDGLREDGVELHFVPEEAAGSDRALTRFLRSLLDREPTRPAVLHSHFHGFDVASVLAAGRRENATVLWHIHSTYSRDPRQVVRAAVKFSTLGRWVDAFLCPADNIVDDTVRRLAPKGKVHFVPSAILVDRFPLASLERKAEARALVGLPTEGTVLLHFGWHWHLKGGDVFLESVKRLADQGMSDIVAVERGGGQEYARYARELGISELLVIEPPVDDVRNLHAAADVLVSSSRMEGMAYALLEALCTGTPVVATDIPGHAYLGRHVEACKVTGHGAAEVANGIAAVLGRDPDAVAAERAAAREWIVENLSTEVVARDLVDRYEALLAGRPYPEARAGKA